MTNAKDPDLVKAVNVVEHVTGSFLSDPKMEKFFISLLSSLSPLVRERVLAFFARLV